MRFWLKATVICSIWFVFLAILFYLYGGTITCLELHNTTDWRGKCGYSPSFFALWNGPTSTIGGFLVLVAGIIIIVAAVWAALILRRRLRQLGEIMASSGSKKYPDTGESGETYDKEDPGRDPSS